MSKITERLGSLFRGRDAQGEPTHPVEVEPTVDDNATGDNEPNTDTAAPLDTEASGDGQPEAPADAQPEVHTEPVTPARLTRQQRDAALRALADAQERLEQRVGAVDRQSDQLNEQLQRLSKQLDQLGPSMNRMAESAEQHGDKLSAIKVQVHTASDAASKALNAVEEIRSQVTGQVQATNSAVQTIMARTAETDMQIKGLVKSHRLMIGALALALIASVAACGMLIAMLLG